MSSIKRKIYISIFFTGIIVLFFSSVLVGKKTLLSQGPNMFPDKSMIQEYLPNSLQDDIASSWIDVPYSFLNHSFIKKFQLPIWNQYSALGYPLAADLESSAFFPLHMPSLLGMASWDIYLITRIMIAMVSMYLFLREIKLKSIPSLLGAFLYAFSGYFAYYINTFILNVDMFLPLGLFFAAKLASENSFTNKSLFLCVLFLMLNGGNPQAAILAILFIDAFYIYHILFVHDGGRRIEKIKTLISLHILGACLSAYNYLPFLELYRNSWTIHESIAGKHMTHIALSNFVFPYLIGYLRGDMFNGIMSTRVIPYFGIVPVWLILISSLHIKNKRYILFSFIVLAFWYFKLVGSIPLTIIAKLPFMASIWFNKYTATLFISASILAASGLHVLMETLELRKKSIFPFVASLMLVVALLLIGSYLDLHINVSRLMPTNPDSDFINKFAQQRRVIGMEFLKWELLISLGILLISAFQIKVIQKKYSKRFIMPLSLIVLCFAIAENFLYAPKQRYDKFDPAQTFSYVNFLKRDTSIFRTYGIEQTIIPQQNIFYGIYDIRIVSPLLYSRYAYFFRELLIHQVPQQFQPYLGSQDSTMKNVNNVLLSLLNVKYILSNNYLPKRDNYRLVYDSELKIYLNESVLPRAFFVNKILPGNEKNDIFAILGNGSFQPGKVAVVEDIDQNQISQLDLTDSGARSRIVIQRYEATNVQIGVVSSKRKFLILSDLYYPGWKAYIDGKETKIYPSNYIMRGIFIPTGSHTVAFRYEPSSLRLGILISMITFCLLMVPVYMFLNVKNE